MDIEQMCEVIEDWLTRCEESDIKELFALVEKQQEVRKQEQRS